MPDGHHSIKSICITGMDPGVGAKNPIAHTSSLSRGSGACLVGVQWEQRRGFELVVDPARGFPHCPKNGHTDLPYCKGGVPAPDS
jgi:hypothetical protein